MELRHLEHFVAVAEESSFTRAAARLYLGQSALSVSVRSLERELDSRLFDRSTHHVRLTDAGRALLPEARAVLLAAESARDAVAAVRGGVRGSVRVGIMHAMTMIDFAGLLTRYHREHPRVRIVPGAAQNGSVELVAQVLDGRLDLAFAALPGDYPAGLTVHPLTSEPMLLACPEDHPFAARDAIGLAELDGLPFVDFPEGWGIRLSADRLFRRTGIGRTVGVEVADVPTVVELVRAGFGFAFLTATLAAGSRGGVGLRPVRPEPLFVTSLVTASDRRPSAAARALIDLVRREYPAPEGRGAG
ncbi:LysR family transcriptional regulator [Streptomyces sp. NPDC093252]|uniref:LysR family transcriptional regulator n=1 Tax=Streptomyces sp. NPDC093252 TaxID=3154980 RepID=UPI00343CE266